MHNFFDQSPHFLLRILQFTIHNRSLKLIQQTHARICYLGLNQQAPILTKLISAYCQCNRTQESKLVFDSISTRDVYLWNTLINGFAKNNLYDESFDAFNRMCRGEEGPDGFTFSTMAKVSGDIADLVLGESIHGRCVKLGFAFGDPIVSNSLVSMYSKCDRLAESQKLFDEMPLRTVSSWNVILAGCANSGNGCFHDQVWDFVNKMRKDGLKPNAVTVSSLLPLCGCRSGMFDYGREIHGYIIRNELEVSEDSDVHLGCCLIYMYSKNNKVNLGRRVFDQMKVRNNFAWTAMINGYVQNDNPEKATSLFREMEGKARIKPNKVSLLSMLSACSSLASLTGAEQIHSFIIKRGFQHETSLSNSLIDVYSKCGSLNHARRVFELECIFKDAISWSSMISGYGLHWNGQEAIVLYDKMLEAGIKPDTITVVGVLSACARSRLVAEGLNIYDTAVNVFGLKPTAEICACVVDMLGGSGQLDEALNFIKTMPVEPGPSVWGALVSASVVHGNYEMRTFAYKALIQLEPENPSNYVSLSNLYASSRRWDAVAEVRSMMKERGLRKLPGWSWISINSETHSFCAADKGHPRSGIIYEMLNGLILAMERAGYSPDHEIFNAYGQYMCINQ